ncbi:MAG: anti-sigma factor family protein [Desulfitobacteriaceae bacterium]
MTNHLFYCSECRHTVSDIRDTSVSFAENQTVLQPPVSIKINVMAAIDKQKYNKGAIPHSQLLDLKNWGFSMIVAGLIIFVINLSPLAPYFASRQVANLNSIIGKQIALPVEIMSLATHAALEKIGTLNINW